MNMKDIVEQNSIRDAAKILGISKSKLHRIIKKNNWKSKDRGPLSKQTRDKISKSCSKFWNSKRSLKIRNQLQKSKIRGVKRRSVTRRRTRRGSNKYLDFLFKEFVNNSINVIRRDGSILEFPEYRTAIKLAPIAMSERPMPDYTYLIEQYVANGIRLIILNSKQNLYSLSEFRRIASRVGIELV